MTTVTGTDAQPTVWHSEAGVGQHGIFPWLGVVGAFDGISEEGI